MSFSVTEENYIKAIFYPNKKHHTISTNDLAAALDTRPASVTDMLKKLKTKKLLSYEKYKGVRLSSEGKKLALAIVRKHRLWEYFLVNTLQFGWDEVHEVAEELEHITSKKLVDKLDAFLGHPKFDPHGDPIPDRDGRIEMTKQVCLLELPVNKTAVVAHVSDQSNGMLELLTHKHIALGTKLEVKKRFNFDQSMELKIGRHNAIMISEQLGKNIFVKYGT